MLRLMPCLLLTAFTVIAPLAQTPQMSFDVLIRNARVMDGTGNPWLRADVGIRGDRIAAVGRFGPAATAQRTIDAGGRLATPGFIDVHSHALEGLERPPLRQARPLLA